MSINPTPNLVPCRGCGRMPSVTSLRDNLRKEIMQAITCHFCRADVYTRGEDWNAAQRPGGVMLLPHGVHPSQALQATRNDTEALQQDAQRLSALLRESADIIERMAGRL